MTMPEPSLTLVEARERAQLLRVAEYDVRLDLTRGDDVFQSSVILRFTCTQPGATTFIELRAEVVTEVTLNGAPLPLDHDGHRIEMPNLAADNELTVVADVKYVHTGDGLHRFVDPTDGETYVGAYLGMDYCRRIFACFDQPDLKAPITLHVTAPSDWLVVSNSLPLHEGDGSWDFAPTPPISTYGFALVAGPWHRVTRVHRDVPFSIIARRSLASWVDEQAEDIFAVTTACFDHYLETFDEPYAFDSYDSAFVPELNWGAMESPGCVTFRDSLIFRGASTQQERLERAFVIAHEMAHMWFGNLATFQWWDDTWLNESFAEYMAYETLTTVPNYNDPWPAFAMVNKSHGSEADQRPSTHPVAPDADGVRDVDAALSNFDGISYAKGSYVLRQLAAWVGAPVFFRGVNVYLSENRFGNATLKDFLSCVQRFTDLDVAAWADGWLQTSGLDTLRVVEKDGHVVVHLDGTRPHHVNVGHYHLDDDRLTLRRRTSVDVDPVSEPRASLTGPDDSPSELVFINDDDVNFAKIRLSPKSIAVTREHLSGFDSALPRAVAWTMFRDLVRDAEFAPLDYIGLVTRHLPSESHSSIFDGVLAFATSNVLDEYLAPTPRVQAARALHNMCAGLVSNGDADSSGIRLAVARSLVATATADDVGDLRKWLASDAIVVGLPLDADLRWRVLLRLSVFGAISGDEIASEAARDVSGTAETAAPRCLAALPTESAKDEAWHTIFEGGASTYVVSATAQGFWQPEQRDLLAPYVSRYFQATIDVDKRRGSPTLSRRLAWRGFPFHDVNETTYELALSALATPGLAEGIHRSWTDAIDDYARALRVRSTFD